MSEWLGYTSVEGDAVKDDSVYSRITDKFLNRQKLELQDVGLASGDIGCNASLAQAASPFLGDSVEMNLVAEQFLRQAASQQELNESELLPLFSSAQSQCMDQVRQIFAERHALSQMANDKVATNSISFFGTGSNEKWGVPEYSLLSPEDNYGPPQELPAPWTPVDIDFGTNLCMQNAAYCNNYFS